MSQNRTARDKIVIVVGAVVILVVVNVHMTPVKIVLAIGDGPLSLVDTEITMSALTEMSGVGEVEAEVVKSGSLEGEVLNMMLINDLLNALMTNLRLGNSHRICILLEEGMGGEWIWEVLPTGLRGIYFSVSSPKIIGLHYIYSVDV